MLSENETWSVRNNLRNKVRNNFLEKIAENVAKKLAQTFYKKSKLSIFLGKHCHILYSLFLSYVQVEEYQNILKLRCKPLAFI